MRFKAKLLVILVLFNLIIGMFSFVTFADPIITIGTVTQEQIDNLIQITVPYTSVDVSQATLIAIKGTTDTVIPEATDANIMYIDQQAVPTSGSGEFKFKVIPSSFTTEKYLHIKLGGTRISEPVSTVIQINTEPTSTPNDAYISIDNIYAYKSSIASVPVAIGKIDNLYNGKITLSYNKDELKFLDITYADGFKPESFKNTVDENAGTIDIEFTNSTAFSATEAAELMKINFLTGEESNNAELRVLNATYSIDGNSYLDITSNNIINGSVTVCQSSSLIYGDVTHDGNVDSNDAVWILQYIDQNREFDAEQDVIADFNKDGVINESDASDILKYELGLI